MKVFASRRQELVAALVAVVGATALTACGSDTATYKPAPRYTNQAPSSSSAPATVYQQPAQPAQPAKKGGQMACGGGGKCG